MRIGCDVGGTFTDFAVLLDDGQVVSGKLLTTPDDPARAVVEWLRSYHDDYPELSARLTDLVHGSTLAINALLQRRGARTVLVTTKGFRDVLLLRRGRRPDMYDIQNDGAASVVPRSLCVELDERLLPNGRVHRAASQAALREAAARVRQLAAESVAVSLLHSYIDPRHERAMAEALASEVPDAAVSLSCEVAPEIKEYERACTTAVDAYVKPLVSTYVARLAADLRGLAPNASFDLVLSSGSRVSASTAVRFPSRLIESGPAAGVVAAVQLARSQGLDRIFAFDMGGTSAKGCIATSGEVPITRDYEVDRSVRFKRGSGLPVDVPTVDLIEIGCGGGSIARIGGLGLMTVGPQSAGAVPGPACYGLGGTTPTVTDADLILGYLDSKSFLGGDFPLDRDAARESLGVLAGVIGLGIEETAWGVHSIANESMANAMKTYAAERGASLDRVALAAYGGAGPVHAADLATRLHAARILVPSHAGVASAVGMLMAQPSFETVRTYKRRLDAADGAVVCALFRALVEEGAAAILEGNADTPVEATHFAEVCYAGQGSTLMVEIPDVSDPTSIISSVRGRFTRAYRERFGSEDPSLEPELATLRAVVSLKSSSRSPSDTNAPERAGPSAGPDVGTTRDAYDPPSGAFIDFLVLDRRTLPVGYGFTGPTLIEERETTTVVPTGWTGSVSADGTLVLEALVAGDDTR